MEQWLKALAEISLADVPGREVSQWKDPNRSLQGMSEERKRPRFGKFLPYTVKTSLFLNFNFFYKIYIHHFSGVHPCVRSWNKSHLTMIYYYFLFKLLDPTFFMFCLEFFIYIQKWNYLWFVYVPLAIFLNQGYLSIVKRDPKFTLLASQIPLHKIEIVHYLPGKLRKVGRGCYIEMLYF